MTYIDIQNEVIKKYRIDLCDGTKCKDGDWSRMHAHPKQRRVCKWKQKNSIQATFDLFHEIGHIENNAGWMRRAEQEYFATAWAIGKCKEYDVGIQDYQGLSRLHQHGNRPRQTQRRQGIRKPQFDLVKRGGHHDSIRIAQQED